MYKTEILFNEAPEIFRAWFRDWFVTWLKDKDANENLIFNACHSMFYGNMNRIHSFKIPDNRNPAIRLRLIPHPPDYTEFTVECFDAEAEDGYMHIVNKLRRHPKMLANEWLESAAGPEDEGVLVDQEGGKERTEIQEGLRHFADQMEKLRLLVRADEIRDRLKEMDERAEIQERWEAMLASNSFTVDQVDGAVRAALAWLNPEQFLIEREPGGPTVVYDIVYRAGGRRDVWGRYTIAPDKAGNARHFLNWFYRGSDSMRTAILKMILHELNELIEAAGAAGITAASGQVANTISGGIVIVAGDIVGRDKTISDTAKRYPMPSSLPEFSVQLVQIRKLMIETFNESELKDLCFDLGEDYDGLPGNNKSDKARELISLFRRKRRVFELVEECRKQRPHEPWPDSSMLDSGTT